MVIDQPDFQGAPEGAHPDETTCVTGRNQSGRVALEARGVGRRRTPRPSAAPAGRGALPVAGHVDERADPGVVTTASRPGVTLGLGQVGRLQEPVSDEPLPIAETKVAPASEKPVT